MTESDIDVHLIPDTLADLEQWICWQEIERDGKATKVPIKPYHTNGTPNASATDPATWRNLETALAFHESDRVRTDGLGFVFVPETPIVGVDLDDCRDPATGELDSWARDIVERLDSYTEVSPSGRGIHVLLEGELPPGRNRRGAVEMYDTARFFTVTTDHIEATPRTVEHRQDALLGVHYEYVQTPPDEEASASDIEEATVEAAETAVSGADSTSSAEPPSEAEIDDADSDAMAIGSDSGLYARYGLDYPDIEDPGLEAALHGLSPSALPDPLPTSMDDIAGPGVALDDEELLERAMDSKSGVVIEALYDGREELWGGRDSRYPSQSEADMGLCFYLGFWTGGDPERMDRLFRDSGLMRGKWDRVHFANGATYGEVCLSRTLLTVDDYYTPPSETAPSSSTGRRGPADDSNASTRTSRDPDPPPMEAEAVEDAKRLAAKVQRQQRELDTAHERIADLEERLRRYRAVLGVDASGDGPCATGSGWGVDAVRNGSHTTPVAPRQSGLDYSDDQEAERFTETHSSLLEDQTSADEDEPSHEADEEGSESSESPGGLTGRLCRWFF
jgi:primase-polymerase (primpol)-like protein